MSMLVKKPVKVLIIDGDASVSEIFKRSLIAEDYEVSTTTDAQESLFLLRSQFFNVMILDINLQEIDRLSLLQKIKDASPDTEIIMITGHSDMETSILSFKSGAHDYSMKPIDANHLIQIIKKRVEKQRLEFEKRYLISESDFKRLLVEEQKRLLEEKLIGDDQRIYQLVKEEIEIKKLLEEMIESLPLGIMVVDKEGQILMCNKVQEIFSGLSRNSLLRKNLFQDPPLKDLEPWQKMGKNFVNSGTYEVKVFDQRPEKDVVLAITLSSLVDETGSSKGFIFLSANITDEKKIEKQIIQAEKMTAIGQLVTSLAHQIRNPLAIIMSAAQHCLEKDGNGNGLKKYYEIIYRNILNANKTISDLLDFARPKLLELKKHNINLILEEVCRLIRIDFSENRIKVLRRFNRDLPKILCDKESLKQVFFNLLMNSKQAMPRGGCVSLTTSYNPGDQVVCIIVEDTGNGIPKEHMPRIFDPYFSTKKKGTGLGLPFVHRIISDHLGSIIPESKEGEGTKMTIILPIDSMNLFPQKISIPKIREYCENPDSIAFHA
jgi:PAS domain S-box-containing protein